jgi:cytochrome P450
MVCYPEVQKKAQTELDNVLNGRLPEHSDIFSLPYLSALVKEVIRYAAIFKNLCLMLSVSASFTRWEPVGPLGRPLFLYNILVSSRPPASVDQRLG